MIYQVPNFVTNLSTYFCPDQATIDDGIAKGYTGDFVIGNENDANALLQTNQQIWLPTILNLFSVNKGIDVDPIQTTWIVCDLDTEPANTDVDYNVFDVINGYYNMATGLDNAKTLLDQTKQNYINWAMQIISFETFPKQKQTISTGTQTL